MEGISLTDARHRRRGAFVLPHHAFCWLIVGVLIAALSGCHAPSQGSAQAAADPRDAEPQREQKADRSASEIARAPSAQSDDLEAAVDEPEAEDVVVTPTGKAYRLAFKYRPGDKLYYTIENKIRDSGGVPPLLTYTTSIEDRRFITQHILPQTPEQKNTASLRRLVNISWECDRYDVREIGMKDESVYDSLRHTYPPSPIRRLGGIPGSTSTFLLNPRTGEASRVRVQLATVSGGSGGRGKLSKIAEKVQLSVTNLKDLLDDLGPFYLPTRSVCVGEQWVRTQRETHRTFGTIITKVTCTLESVQDMDGRQVATILIEGELSLQQKPEEPDRTPESATTKPARRRPLKTSAKDYKIDKQACSGRVEFDITRGELIELTLRREREFVADVDAEKTSGLVTEIRQATAHELKVSTSRDAPRYPTIIGGPKPPIEPIDAPSLATPPARKNPSTSEGNTATRRADTTSQPTTTTATRAASQPTSRPTRRHNHRPTTQQTRPKPAQRAQSQPTAQPVPRGGVAAKIRVNKNHVDTVRTKRLPKGWRRGLQPATQGRAGHRPGDPSPPTDGDQPSAEATSQPARQKAS